MTISSEVIDRLRKFEGVIPYMYLDTDGNVTVGVGHLLSNSVAANPLPFVDKKSNLAAVDTQKAAEWQTVSDLDAGHAASYYDRFTQLKLQDADINALLSGDAAKVEDQLRDKFFDYDTFPEKAQAGLIDMGFNLGVPKLIAKFPTFVKAVKGKDWATAAAECHRKPPVSENRNNEIKQLFLDAASGFRESSPFSIR